MTSENHPEETLLVVRNDKLGDFMLAWPALAMLRQALPAAHIGALVSEYTVEMAELCPSIDEILVDPLHTGGGVLALRSELRNLGVDALITLFSTTRVGLAGWLARVPERIAPATKVAQVFYNRRIVQRRSRSEKPEFEYNLDLVRAFLAARGMAPPAAPRPPFLQFDAGEIAALRAQYIEAQGIPPEHRLLYLHPGSGGSAGNLSVEQYAMLARGLKSGPGHTLVITAGPGELETARVLAAQLGDAVPWRIFHSTRGLAAFARRIAMADLFIAGSTGPLHIAGALDVPTAAFYTRRRSATALRWQTLNAPERRLAFSPPSEAEAEDMTAVDIDRAAASISEAFLTAKTQSA